MNISLKSLVLLVTFTPVAHGFTLNIDNGYFYGPGDAIYNDTEVQGVNKFVDAEVRNIVLTGPLTGFIPFDNNGGEEPNVIAERLHAVGEPVDGLASDGTRFNENADTALRLNIRNPTSLESEDYMVVALFSEDNSNGGEPISPDDKGNLTFRPFILADPGYTDGIVRFNVEFTTGVAQVPPPLNSDGVYAAGPLQTGTTLVGQLGDFDLDGYLDGVLVLAANAPLEMRVARGNPIAQVRPFTSDIPISAQEAIFLTLQNLLSNYPSVISQKLGLGEYRSLAELTRTFREGVVSARDNTLKVFLEAQDGNLSSISPGSLELSLSTLRQTMTYLQSIDFEIEAIIKQSAGTYDAGPTERQQLSLQRKFTRVFNELGSLGQVLGSQ